MRDMTITEAMSRMAHIVLKSGEDFNDAKAWDVILAHLHPAVPEGWKLVPEKITIPMYRAFMKATNNKVEDYGFNDAYQAMLSAAPESGGG